MRAKGCCEAGSSMYSESWRLITPPDGCVGSIPAYMTSSPYDGNYRLVYASVHRVGICGSAYGAHTRSQRREATGQQTLDAAIDPQATFAAPESGRSTERVE